jgi:DNA-binding MarR family transcriptional regulator
MSENRSDVHTDRPQYRVSARHPIDPDPIDHESRVGDGDHLALRLWLRLLSCTNRVEAPLRSRLRERFGGSLPRFDLMAQLDRHPDGLKMRELSQRLMVTGGNVTGLTDRLVHEGLVERSEDPEDRRAFTIRLTAEGRRQFRAMAREHEAWVATLFDGLDAGAQTELFRLLGLLKQALPASPPPGARRRPPPMTRSSAMDRPTGSATATTGRSPGRR